MRVVLDTWVLNSAILTTDTPPALIYQAWRKKPFELVTSEWQLDEFRRVSRHSRRRRFLNPAEAGNLVSGLSRQATILETMPTVGVSPDPGDNPVLAMAGDLAPEGLVFIPASKSPNGKPLVDSTSRCL